MLMIIKLNVLDAVRAANPDGEIALGLPVPQKGNKGEWIDKSVINVDVQKIVREVAAAAGVARLVDFFGALGGIEPDTDLLSTVGKKQGAGPPPPRVADEAPRGTVTTRSN